MNTYYAQTKFLLDDADPPISYTEEQEDGEILFSLPFADGAEYRFLICVFIDPESEHYGSLQISAELKDTANEQWFWYMASDVFDAERLQQGWDSYSKTLNKLLTNQTRIVQRKGVLFSSFRLEMFDKDGWKHVYTNAAWRFISRIPKTAQKEKIYICPPIANLLGQIEEERVDQHEE